MKVSKHIQSKEKSNFTFIIVPNSSEKVMQFTLPRWFTKALPIGVALILLSSILFSSGYFLAKHNLSSAKKEIASLKLENTSQKLEIAELKNYSTKVDEKLADLNEIQNQMLDMVGLSPEEYDHYPLASFAVSRGEQLSLFSSQGQGYEEEIDLLTDLIDKEKENIKNVMSNVEKQLEYIDALPNLLPNDGRMTSPFGYRTSPTGRKREFHNGIDLANKSGSDIVAAGSGIVTFSGYNGGYGKMVMVSHGYGYTSIYAHNQQNTVSVGDSVEKGQVIGRLGNTGRSTGPHVHFEVRLDNKPIDPLTLLED